MENELKPCPFCGGEATIDEYGSTLYEAACTNSDCHATIGEYLSKDHAVEAWNTRPQPSGRGELVEISNRNRLLGELEGIAVYLELGPPTNINRKYVAGKIREAIAALPPDTDQGDRVSVSRVVEAYLDMRKNGMRTDHSSTEAFFDAMGTFADQYQQALSGQGGDG